MVSSRFQMARYVIPCGMDTSKLWGRLSVYAVILESCSDPVLFAHQYFIFFLLSAKV